MGDWVADKLASYIGTNVIADSTTFKNEAVGSKYDYPTNNSTISQKLKGEKGYIDIKKYIEYEKTNIQKQTRLFRELIPNGTLNPAKDYKLLDYFVKGPTYDEMDIIFKMKDNPILKKNIAHVGNKGCGKTALQNCWLKENNTKLELNSIYWVRCDAHKLYELWHSFKLIDKNSLLNHEDYNILNTRLPTIHEYLDIQLLYVFAKYCHERPFFIKIYEALELSNPDFRFPIGRVDTTTYETRKLSTEINKIHQTIIDNENDEIDLNYSYAYDHVMIYSLSSRQREKDRWIAISKALQKFLYNNDIWVLKILDGLDNVHINDERSIPYYNFMISEASSFIMKKSTDKQMHFAAMRERTFIDIQPIVLDISSDSPYYKMVHSAAAVKDIWDKRIEYASKEIDNFGEIGEILGEIINSIQIKDNRYIHNNIRSFLYNKVSLALLVYYRKKQLGGGTYSISNIIEILENRNYFLNGRLFLNTNVDWIELNRELGVCSTNIFYFDINKYFCNSMDSWYGLCKTRIIQELIRGINKTESSLINFMVNILHYPKDLVFQSIYDLRSIGCIDSEYSNHLFYEISDYGRLFYELAFSDFDTLYYFSIDTLLPVNFVNNNWIDSHNNKFKIRTNYPYASTISVITFISFLRIVNNFENDKLQEYRDSGNNLIDIPDNFTLPFDDTNCCERLLKRCLTNISMNDPNHEGSIENYLKDIERYE